MFKHTKAVLRELIRVVHSSPEKKAWLVEGEATICTSKLQMGALARPHLNIPAKRVAEFTESDVTYINTNIARLASPNGGDGETQRWIESKYKDLFGDEVVKKAEAKKSEAEKAVEDFDAKFAALQEAPAPAKAATTKAKKTAEVKEPAAEAEVPEETQKTKE